MQRLFLTAMLIRDYDEAIAFYAGTLGFEARVDTPLEGTRRWVVLAPPGSGAGPGGGCILLARAETVEQAPRIGDQTGGRVFLFLDTDDFARDHAAFRARGVRFVEEPRCEPYGTVAVFEDLYGNRWHLIEHRAPFGLGPSA